MQNCQRFSLTVRSTERNRGLNFIHRLLAVPQPERSIMLNLTESSFRPVLLTYISSDFTIYVHHAEQGQILEQLQCELREHFSQLQSQGEHAPRKGHLIAARSNADDQWYRARVQRIQGKTRVHVNFIDYGNSEVISDLNRLAALPPSTFMKSIQCALTVSFRLVQSTSASPCVRTGLRSATAGWRRSTSSAQHSHGSVRRRRMPHDHRIHSKRGAIYLAPSRRHQRESVKTMGRTRPSQGYRGRRRPPSAFDTLVRRIKTCGTQCSMTLSHPSPGTTVGSCFVLFPES